MKAVQLSFSLLVGLLASLHVEGFSPLGQRQVRPSFCSSATTTVPATARQATTTVLQQSSSDDSEKGPGIWSQTLRRIMGGIAGVGAVETAFLTYEKFTNSFSLCGVDGDCNAVLTGPYSHLPFVEAVPLSAVGFLAYCLAAYLALEPLSDENAEDGDNRVALTALTTAMGTFSVGLMILLFGVLQTTCPYCILSATCSSLLALVANVGGCLPASEECEGNGSPITGSFLASTLGLILLFVSGGGLDGTSASTMASSISSSPSASTTFLAKADSKEQPGQLFSPPAITTESSKRALELADSLQALNAKMYGAYWCSHCYDQKEALGKQAFGKIQYVECSKDGVNSQNKLCKSKQVPGYPTWEIQGELYPGEQELDELEDLVKTIRATMLPTGV